MYFYITEHLRIYVQHRECNYGFLNRGSRFNSWSGHQPNEIKGLLYGLLPCFQSLLATVAQQLGPGGRNTPRTEADHRFGRTQQRQNLPQAA